MCIRDSLEVAQVVEPLSEEDGFANFNHAATVAPWLHPVNAIRATLGYSIGLDRRDETIQPLGSNSRLGQRQLKIQNPNHSDLNGRGTTATPGTSSARMTEASRQLVAIGNLSTGDDEAVRWVGVLTMC